MPLPPEFDFITTRDGSPTLAYRRADGFGEHMHHSAGALTESLFIYGHALDLALSTVPEVAVLSVGLGLGYNELLTIARLEREGRPGRIHSFEKIDFLRREFVAWAGGRTDGPLAPTYDEIARRLDLDVKIVARWRREGRLLLHGEFPAATVHAGACNLVYFDAYSNKMDPHLWREDDLVEVFGRALAPTCVFATYAATSVLNRVLRRLKLRRLRRRGFYMKRQSTLAIRLASETTA